MTQGGMWAEKEGQEESSDTQGQREERCGKRNAEYGGSTGPPPDPDGPPSRAPALLCHVVPLTAVVRVRIGYTGLAPAEADGATLLGDLDQQTSMVPSWPCVRVL